MERHFDETILVVLIVSLIAILPGAANADSEITVIGFVGDDGQLFGDDGIIYEIAEDEIGDKLMELAGLKVIVSGFVMRSEEIIIITVTKFEVIQK